MSFLSQNKKKLIKNLVIQINSFIVDILINGFFVVIVFVDTKCVLYDIVNDKCVKHFDISRVFIQFCFFERCRR